MPSILFGFGLSYSTLCLAWQLIAEGWQISGTSRSADKKKALAAEGLRCVLYDGSRTEPDVVALLQDATHVLLSIPPDDEGDPAYRHYGETLRSLPGLQWVGYFSTTGVYGDHQGGWVDENTPPHPVSGRQNLRVVAEAQWLESGLPVHIFRLAGIYGPGRNPIEQLRRGTAKRIFKENQFFSRIHVEDIAAVVRASIAKPTPGEIFNVCDNEPAPAHEVVAYAAELIGVTPPPLVPCEEADLSPMARSFYSNSRKVRNDKLKQMLGVSLHYPTYREGLQALQKLTIA